MRVVSALDYPFIGAATIPPSRGQPSIRKDSSAAGFRSIKNNIQATIYPGPKMLLILIPRPFTDLLQHNWSSPAILGE